MVFQKAMIQLSLLAMDWDIESFLTNLANSIKKWGGLALVVLGVCMVLVAVFKTATGLMNHGKGQPPNWLMILILFLLGGALCAAGGTQAWDFVSKISKGGSKTIEDLGGVIMLLPGFMGFLG